VRIQAAGTKVHCDIGPSYVTHPMIGGHKVMLQCIHLSVPFSDCPVLKDGDMCASLFQMYLIGDSMVGYAHMQMLLAGAGIIASPGHTLLLHSAQKLRNNR